MSKISRKQDKYDVLVKLIIIGDSGVGKTNILMRFCDSEFKDNYVATIGVDFKVKIIQVDDKRIKLQIWDTAGQQRFKNITQTYYKGAVGIILTYSVTDEHSFENIEKWIAQINDNTQSDVKKILVANKCDLNHSRQVSTQSGQKLANKYSMPFMEVSAKNGDNIDKTFTILGQAIKKKLDDESGPSYFKTKLGTPTDDKKKDSKCC